MSNLNLLVQNYKAKIQRKYYHYRIDSNPNPYQIALRKQPYRVIFILGHMRSASSLLVHILNSNPEIIGYGESHIRYSNEQDMKKLLHKVYARVGKLSMTHPYILDKLLHNSKLLDDNILKSENIYKIFLVRSPQKTLPSILKIKPHWSQEKTFDHYVSRLATLERYAKLIDDRERSLFITYDQFLNQTEEVFHALQMMLGVKEAFSEQYQVLGTTGKRGVGDSSANIKQGVIIRDGAKSDRESSLDWIQPSIENYNQCCSVLSQYCNTI